MKIKIINPSCNLNTIKDGRGGIFSYIPEAPIHEWTHQYIKAGKIRGNHSHPEFDEYIMLIDGAGVEVERDPITHEENFIEMNKGTCIFIPRGISHVFLAITDCESISFLTKKWDDCRNPIVHENLGHGDGDHGDPNSPFYKKNDV